MNELDDVLGRYVAAATFPRPIADGVHWLGGCSAILADEDRNDVMHSALNAYLVLGAHTSLLVDSGHPALWPHLRRQLDMVLGHRKLNYVMPTHPELPHAGSLSLLHWRYPELKVVGDVRDHHLYHPRIPDAAYVPKAPGDVLDLGGRTFEFISPVWSDLPNTIWGFDHHAGVLFPADAFAYFHWHSADDCARVTSEVGQPPTATDYATLSAEILHWVQFTDPAPSIREFQTLVHRLAPRVVAPAHGTVVDEVDPFLAHFTDALYRLSQPTAG